ncbi:metallophosphoesterase [Proteiniclasticum sp. C24MP]|uniref:metallophosphoesterase n=1 Tax=Proteiniclasticum sp. C24MP TaxID=3374101 RepID=UPI00375466D5
MEIMIALLLVAALRYYFDNYTFAVKEIEVSSENIPKGFHEYRILHISDLHNTRYGRGNSRLISKVLELNPDAIFYTGDMISRQSLEKGQFEMLIEGLSHKYPSYYVDGNHEDELYGKDKEAFISLLRRNGIRHLENEKVLLERKGDQAALYGLRLPRRYLRNTYDAQGKEILTKESLKKSLGPLHKGFTMMLAHNPLYFPVYAEYGTDLVFSGHVHGGLVRLPVTGGVFSPDRTFFPRYARGVYEERNKKIIVSPGIGGIKLRIINRPAIYVVRLMRKESETQNIR